jgi:flavodoxin
MRAMVVYDSMYGNTKEIAGAIGRALGPQEEVEIVQAGEARPQQLAGLTLLVVGSPTQRFSPTAATSEFLKGIPEDGLKGIKVAAFDTRFPEGKIEEIRILAFFVRLFGYAAEPIAKRLQKKGGELVVPLEGFCVGDTEGPLLEGELERAVSWAEKIVSTTR